MRVHLNILERVMLFEFISSHPTLQQGNASTWRHIEAAKAVLSLTDKENEEYGIVIEGGKLYIKNKDLADKKMEFTLPDPLVAKVITVLSEMNQKNELKSDTFKLYEALVKEEETSKGTKKSQVAA